MAVHASGTGQPEFESKDCHLQMKIREITVILSDNCLFRNGSRKLYGDRLHRIWECTVHFVFCNYVTLTWVSVPPERHELSISAWNVWCEGPSPFYRESQLNEGMAGNGLDPKAWASPRTVRSFARCRRARQFCLRYSRHSVGCGSDERRTQYGVEARCLHAWLTSRMQNISWVGLSCTVNFSRGAWLSS